MRSVRFRLTAIAAGVTIVVAGALGWWVVRSVENTLTAQSAADRDRTITAVQLDLDSGKPVTDEQLRSLANSATTGQVIEVEADGDVIASSRSVTTPDLPEATDPGVTGPREPVSTTDTGGDGAARPATSASDQPGSTRSSDYAVTRTLVPTERGPVIISAESPLGPLRQSVAATRQQLVWALPALVLLVGGLTWWLAGRALRPVERIRREVDEISGSTLDRRVAVPRSGDEVSALAVTMNSMLDRLDRSSERQRQFIADASHELRSPVSAIRAELEVARMTAGPDDWPEIAEQVLAEEGRLERVIDDLLTLARLDETGVSPGSGATNPETVDLGGLVAQVVEPIADRQRTITVDLDANGAHGATIDGVPSQLERLIANLVENAVRHAHSTTSVTVEARVDAVTVQVDDDGPGVPATDRERIFERFVRLDEHRSRGTGAEPTTAGAGLGLALVRRIADAHHATVAVDDSPLGGACFTVSFPASPRSPS